MQIANVTMSVTENLSATESPSVTAIQTENEIQT